MKSLLHEYLTHKLYINADDVDNMKIIDRDHARKVLGNGHNIPKTLQVRLLKELEDLKMIKSINKNKLKILKQKFTIIY